MSDRLKDRFDKILPSPDPEICESCGARIMFKDLQDEVWILQDKVKHLEDQIRVLTAEDNLIPTFTGVAP